MPDDTNISRVSPDLILAAAISYLKDLGYEPSGSSTPNGLGLDSLDAVEILIHCEDCCECEIADFEISFDATLKEWAEEASKHSKKD